MGTSNFVDHVQIYFRSGSGGSGSKHFRREKNVPKGGPDGGDGGKGGDIIIKGNKHLWTLLHLKYHKHISAGNGESGAGQQASGAEGKSQIIEVPPGTVVKDAETNQIITEITIHEETQILLEGGIGGKGNVHFKSATNQTPQYAQPGITGQEAKIVLELKVLADVGTIGYPNAGKSTLLSTLSAAKPQIADYPFTTLTPNLGLVEYKNLQSFVIADIPGIIKGAHQGKGLGTRFLRHIERNALLLFMIPADSDDIKREYQTLLHELKSHNPELMDKKRLLAITKADLLDEELMHELIPNLPDLPYVFISSVTEYGLETLKDKIWNLLNT